MFTVSCQDNFWQINRKDNIVLSGFGSTTTALEIAKLYDISVSQLNTNKEGDSMYKMDGGNEQPPVPQPPPPPPNG